MSPAASGPAAVARAGAAREVAVTVIGEAMGAAAVAAVSAAVAAGNNHALALTEECRVFEWDGHRRNQQTLQRVTALLGRLVQLVYAQSFSSCFVTEGQMIFIDLLDFSDGACNLGLDRCYSRDCASIGLGSDVVRHEESLLASEHGQCAQISELGGCAGCRVRTVQGALPLLSQGTAQHPSTRIVCRGRDPCSWVQGTLRLRRAPAQGTAEYYSTRRLRRGRGPCPRVQGTLRLRRAPAQRAGSLHTGPGHPAPAQGTEEYSSTKLSLRGRGRGRGGAAWCPPQISHDRGASRIRDGVGCRLCGCVVGTYLGVT